MKTLVSIFLITLSLQLSAQQYSLSLSSPQNLDTIMNVRPTFIWNATGINERTSFSLKVCKVSLNQNFADALNLNSPLVQQGPLDLTMLNFPYMEEDLDSSSQYVWQVTMYDSGLPVFISEIYSFYTPFPPVNNEIYWFLNELSQKKYLRSEKLAFSYKNRFNLNSLKVHIIRNIDSEIVYSSEIPIYPGNNFIDLSKINNFPILQQDTYFVNIEVSNNEYFEFTFIQE
jgi:hypothetical protein